MCGSKKNPATNLFTSRADVSDKSIPSVQLAEPEGPCTFSYVAPWDGALDEERCLYFGDVVASYAASTYPGKRLGDPICDCCGLSMFKNRTVACIADGCVAHTVNANANGKPGGNAGNWGAPARDAARMSVERFLEYVGCNVRAARDTRDLAKLLLNGLAMAHYRIAEDSSVDAPCAYTKGTTTLLGGAFAEVRGGGRFAYVVCTIGDCKAYRVSCKTRDVQELSPGCRAASEDATDCGGRIGAGAPDLRNLALFHGHCDEGDMVLLVTDGVHDNFDPQMLGKTPREAAVSVGYTSAAPTWPEVDSLSRERIKREHAQMMLKRVLQGAATPRAVCQAVHAYCRQTTRAGREWMELHTNSRIPADYERYPGKMDHCTSLCFVVGRNELSATSERELPGRFSAKLEVLVADNGDPGAQQPRARSSSWSTPRQRATMPSPASVCSDIPPPVAVSSAKELRPQRKTSDSGLRATINRLRPRILGAHDRDEFNVRMEVLDIGDLSDTERSVSDVTVSPRYTADDLTLDVPVARRTVPVSAALAASPADPGEWTLAGQEASAAPAQAQAQAADGAAGPPAITVVCPPQAADGSSHRPHRVLRRTDKRHRRSLSAELQRK
eukprot:m51a1_g6656 hypothetical protein (613) ;mRNA; f:146103-148921